MVVAQITVAYYNSFRAVARVLSREISWTVDVVNWYVQDGSRNKCRTFIYMISSAGSLSTCNNVVFSIVGAANGAIFPLANTGTLNGLTMDLRDSRPRRLLWSDWSSTSGNMFGFVRSLDQDGNLNVVAGNSGSQGFAGDGIYALDPTVRLGGWLSMLVTPNGDIIGSDQGASRVRRIQASNNFIYTHIGSSTIGCGGDESAPAASGAGAQNVNGMFRDNDTGDLYFVHGASCHRGRRLASSNSLLKAWAGVATSGTLTSGDGGPATAATFKTPYAVTMFKNTSTGDKWWFIAGTLHAYTRGALLDCALITILTSYIYHRLSSPSGYATCAHPLVFTHWRPSICAERDGHVIRRIRPNGIIETIAGTGTATSTGDGGLATSATLNGPRDLAVDARDGTLYFSGA